MVHWVWNLCAGSIVVSGRRLSNSGNQVFHMDQAWVIGGSGSHNQGNANRQSTVAPFGMGPKRLPQLSRSDHDWKNE